MVTPSYSRGSGRTALPSGTRSRALPGGVCRDGSSPPRAPPKASPSSFRRGSEEDDGGRNSTLEGRVVVVALSSPSSDRGSSQNTIANWRSAREAGVNVASNIYNEAPSRPRPNERCDRVAR